LWRFGGERRKPHRHAEADFGHVARSSEDPPGIAALLLGSLRRSFATGLAEEGWLWSGSSPTEPPARDTFTGIVIVVLLLPTGISFTILRMRTTLDLPDALVEEARSTLGYTSKTDTVVFALREVVRRGRIDELKALMGKVDFEFDATELRKKERRRR
jgi:Arc/MetJ family transcription regulator